MREYVADPGVEARVKRGYGRTIGRSAEGQHHPASQIEEGREVLHGRAFRLKSVHHRVWIGVADRHAADDDLALRDSELGADDAVVIAEGSLRTGMQAVAARRHHDVLQEHAVVEPAPQTGRAA